MTPERWLRVTELFDAALGRGPEERAALLDEACDGDEEVRREVESLLTAYARNSEFMSTPAATLLVDDVPALEAGQRFGQYDEIAPLAEGGMGQVYVAIDTRLGRKVALKLLPASHTNDAERVRRFEQEARAVSALNHPNIVTLYEVGEVDSLHFIATEFVDGVTLRERLAGERLTVGEVLDVGVQVASALEAAHEAGVVHRDVKPENVMLRPDGYVKVLDFGIAKLAPRQEAALDANGPAGSSTRTNPGVVMGTTAYMSPEQARGEEVDARTDVWSLGVVLYEMVAGRAPFEGETPNHVVVSILDEEPAPLTLDAGVPSELERIVRKALRKERSERYQTAGGLAEELRKLKEELTVEARLRQFRGQDAPGTATRDADAAVARPTSSAEHLTGAIRRRPGRAALASAAALVLVVSLVYFPPFTGGETIESVAVLPFANVAGDPEVEHLSEAVADGVIANLSRLPDLRVVALSTVMRYKGRQVDPQTIGRELNVRAVLTGRVTRQDDALTIDAELVDVRDHSRLWGARYGGKVSDLLAVQRQIASELTERLGLRPGGPENRRLPKRSTESAEAYDAYLRGRALLEKRTVPALLKSIEYFEKATQLDPDYALAYAFSSYAYWSLGALDTGVPEAEFLPKAKAAATRALEIDDTLAEAHTALGHVRNTEGDLTGAESAFKRGIELDPSSGFVHSNYSHFLRDTGRIEEAVAESRRAVEIEPASALYNRNLGMNLHYARRYDEAIEQFLKTLELESDMPTAYRWLAKSYEQKGLYDQAAEAFLKTKEFGPDVEVAFREVYARSGWTGFWRAALELKRERERQKPVPWRWWAENYVRLGQVDRAFDMHEKANEPVRQEPFWDNLRSNPRYADLVRRRGLDQ
jgi:TolB-like protein/Flp pilus assembly protein TadD